MTARIPTSQRAVQLVGPDRLEFNPDKPVPAPGPYQVLCRVEAVGLCFSDLKLVKGFAAHPRKSEIVSGLDQEVLAEIPSYVPGEAPTVPGHEAQVQIVAAGAKVTNLALGERYLVQADYRWLRTADSNAAFGYNFEGALQEYVLLDERAITSPEGESMLLPAPRGLSASAVALVEPWACVENAYAVRERRALRAGGRLLVAADGAVPHRALRRLLTPHGKPAAITWLASQPPPGDLGVAVRAAAPGETEDGAYDDIAYFGSRAVVVESLFGKLAAGGLLNVALGGERMDGPVAVPVGRVHYGGIRLVGTPSADPAEAMAGIPETGEIRRGDRVNVVGAGGPMGVMHVIRDLCQGIPNVEVSAGDVSDERLAALTRIAGPLAAARGVSYQSYNPAREPRQTPADYTVVMAPLPELVAAALENSAPGAIINIFAGIPAEVTVEIDLNAYLEKRLYLIGTSGSRLEDMRTVLAKIASGRLDTNLSVAAVAGLEGAVSGIRAVESRAFAGKIIVYPSCRGLGLAPLDRLREEAPAAAELLDRGLWNGEAERALLKVYGVPSEEL